jgi:hypothetical protein
MDDWAKNVLMEHRIYRPPTFVKPSLERIDTVLNDAEAKRRARDCQQKREDEESAYLPQHAGDHSPQKAAVSPWCARNAL